MKRLGLAIYLTGFLASAQSPAGRLRAGAAKVDITPRADQLAIATDSIRDPLYVRAIVVDDGGSCAALVNIDGGARDAVVNPAIEKSSASTKCPPENYIISGTHSHSANTGGLGGAGSPDAQTITAAIVSAIDAAKAKLPRRAWATAGPIWI